MAASRKKHGGFREGHRAYRSERPSKSSKSVPRASVREAGNIAKVFMNGRSQAVRLPKAFRVKGDRVRVRREGDAIVLEPIRSLDETLEEIHRLTRGRFPEREQPPMPNDDDLESFD